MQSVQVPFWQPPLAQGEQASPPEPQDAAEFPGMQTPSWQQPSEHDVASQTVFSF